MNLKALFTNVKKDDLFNMIPDIVMILEADYKILDINDKGATLFGYSRFNMIGENISKYVKNGIDKINEALNKKQYIATKIECSSKEEKIAEISAFEDNESSKIYLTLRDITNNFKKQVQTTDDYEVAKSIINDKNSYLTNSSMEILSYVNSIESFSKALIDGVGGPITAKQEKYANIINKNAKELLYNLDKMFLLFKLESDLIRKTYKTFDIVNMLNDMAKRWTDAFRAKNVKFNYDFSNIALRNACLDPVMLELAINSLLEVSLKCTEIGNSTLTVQNPTLEMLKSKDLETETEDENVTKTYLLFEFKDTAASLNEEEISSIFSPYTIIKNPQKKAMGIKFTYPLVKKLIENLGGVMWINAKASLGTVVYFIIPVEKKFQKK